MHTFTYHHLEREIEQLNQHFGWSGQVQALAHIERNIVHYMGNPVATQFADLRHRMLEELCAGCDTDDQVEYDEHGVW